MVWPLYGVHHSGPSGTWPEWAYIVNFIFWSVVCVAVVIGRLFFYHGGQRGRQTSAIVSPPQPSKRTRAGLRALQARDPEFN